MRRVGRSAIDCFPTNKTNVKRTFFASRLMRTVTPDAPGQVSCSSRSRYGGTADKPRRAVLLESLKIMG